MPNPATCILYQITCILYRNLAISGKVTTHTHIPTHKHKKKYRKEEKEFWGGGSGKKDTHTYTQMHIGYNYSTLWLTFPGILRLLLTKVPGCTQASWKIILKNASYAVRALAFPLFTFSLNKHLLIIYNVTGVMLRPPYNSSIRCSR